MRDKTTCQSRAPEEVLLAEKVVLGARLSAPAVRDPGRGRRGGQGAAGLPAGDGATGPNATDVKREKGVSVGTEMGEVLVRKKKNPKNKQKNSQRREGGGVNI